MMTTFTALAGSTVGAVADAVASDSPTPRLADEDVHTYQGYIDAIRLPHEPDPAPRRAALSTALDASAEVPLALTRWAQAAAAARRVGLPYDHLPDRDEES
jgi:hypothetical protein